MLEAGASALMSYSFEPCDDPREMAMELFEAMMLEHTKKPKKGKRNEC
jgi:hypothetical protein